MKKIYLFLATLFGMFGLMSASAQDYDWTYDEDNPLITEVEQFSSPMSDSGEGNFYSLLDRLSECPEDQHPGNDFWHSDWHHGSQTPGTHYFQVEMLDPENLPEEIVFVFTRRSGADNDHTIEWSVRGTNDPDASKEACEELAYIETPFSSTSETLMSDKFDPQHYKYLRFYSEAQRGNNANNYDRGYFHLSRFQLYPVKLVPEWEAAYNMLSDAFNKYVVYAEPDYFPIGTQPGQYGEAEVIALQDAVEAINAYLEELPQEEIEKLTKAKAEELIKACEDAYQAVLATKVTFSLPSGYYHIKAGMEYTNSIVVGQDDEGNDITEDVVRQKYMMGHKENGKLYGYWWDLENFTDQGKDVEAAARVLWKIENKGDGTYDFVSEYHDGRFNNVARSGNVEMDPASENLMAIDPVYTTDEGITYVNIRVSTQNANDYLYLHQGGHSGGTGKKGFLVGWCNTWDDAVGPQASEWYFEKVDDAEAEQVIKDWAPLKDEQALIASIKDMIVEAKEKLEIAKDVAHIGIITEASQFSSPFSQNDLGGKDGGNLSDGVLIDGSSSSYWHSVWSGSEVPDGRHYLQVELPDDFDAAQQIYMQFTRRATDSNHITQWTIRGTNDGEYSDEESCEELMIVDTPYGSNTETLKSDLFDTKGYKFLRFYQSGNSSGAAFFHLSEFQLYYDLENPKSQYIGMGTVAKNLENTVSALEGKEDDALTADDYTLLKTVLDAFNAKFVDPTELRETIAKVNGNSDMIAVGTQPGFWPDNSTGEALDATIAKAKAYDEAGIYTPEESEALVARLKSDDASIIEAAIKVEEGKWYRIRFGSEEEYEANGWPSGGCEEETDDAGNVTNEAIFGKYLVVADFENADGQKSVIQIAPDEVAIENYVFADADDDIVDKDLSLWRFINVGDSAYVIQNKATGLFMRSSDNMRISAMPTLFTQFIAGDGQNGFLTKNLKGDQGSPMHLARNYNILCTWGSLGSDGVWQGMGNKDGRRACFFVEEAEAVANDYDGTAFNMSATPGTVRTYCFPVAIQADECMYELMKAETTPEGIVLTLCPTKEVEAGAPFIFITDGEASEDAEADLIPFSHGYDIVAEPSAKNGLNGALYKTTVGKGVITLTNGKFAVTKSPSATTDDMTAYITNGEEGFDDKLAVTFTIDVEGDNIQAALENVARTGDIYTIDGRLVGKGNLNSLRQKGIYIVNGTKVIVK